LRVGASAAFKLFAIAPVDNLTAPLWRCLDFSRKQTQHNVTDPGIDKVIRTHHQRTVRRHFSKTGNATFWN